MLLKTSATLDILNALKKPNTFFCISVTPQESLASIPARTQTVTKPEFIPGGPKPAPLQGLQPAPVLIPQRPPPKVPTTKKPAPLQKMGVKTECVSITIKLFPLHRKHPFI